MADRTPRNKNRLDLYRRLLTKFIEMDQDSGVQGYNVHWDDPDATWDTGDPWQSWDQLGLSPVYQELFHVIEVMGGEDLELLETLDTYIDPLNCPEDVLGQIAASFGYALDEDASEPRKRLAVQGLMEAYKSLGTFIGFKVFYRLIGFEVVNIFPLWKKAVFEDREDYSLLRYSTTPVLAEAIGPGALTAYAGQLSDGPAKPGTVRFTDGTVVVRDDPQVIPETIDDRRGIGDLIGPNGETGFIRYATGEFQLTFPAPTSGALTVDYERVDEEWPYHAARIDIDINISPGGIPVPILDLEGIDNILRRLDEVRPIHVLLRTLAIVVELRDEFTPGATDEANCTTILKQFLDGQPSILGSYKSYMLDGALGFTNRPSEDEMSIFLDYTVGTDEHIQAFDELAPIVCPLDTLRIAGPPGGPIYA